MRLALTVFFLLSFSLSAHAFNALGHKTVAAIAWQEIPTATRAHIVATLRRHPRFDEDFAKQMPAGLADDSEWVFQHAATWPDLARGLPGEARQTYDHPTWHYVNFPIFHKVELPLFNVNLSTDYPPLGDQAKWNIIQATKHCLAALKSNASPSDKALAYCWLFHLVGDSHQPLHSSALFCERFPTGDRGGNQIVTVQGKNLHSLWDALLGSGHKPNDVKREVAELRARPRLFNVDTKADVETWIKESHELAKSFAYSPEVLQVAEQRGEPIPVQLSVEYLRGAGEHARERIAAAGVRLGAALNALPISEADRKRAADSAKPGPIYKNEPIQSLVPAEDPFAPDRPAYPQGVKAAMGYWLNTNGNVRHNPSCRWYQNTKRGRECSATDGRACGICGG